MFKPEDMSQRLLELRKRHQLTQAHVAEALNVSYQAISSWERGLTMPDITKLPEICKLYQVSMEDLFSPTFEPGELHREIDNNTLIDDCQLEEQVDYEAYRNFKEDIVLLDGNRQLENIKAFIEQGIKPLSILNDNVIFLSGASTDYILSLHQDADKNFNYHKEELREYVGDFCLMTNETIELIIDLIIQHEANNLGVLDDAICMINAEQKLKLITDLVHHGHDPAEILAEFSPLLNHQIIEYLISELEKTNSKSEHLYDIDQAHMKRSLRHRLFALQE